MRPLLTLLLIIVLNSCSSTRSIKDYTRVDINEISKNSEKFHDQYIAVEGYVLGVEYEHKKAIDDPDLLIICLGDQLQPDPELAQQIIFPEYKYKIRVGEDGFNRSVIRLCRDVAMKAVTNKRKVIIYGHYLHKNEYAHFKSGVNLLMAKLQYRDKVLNSDFEDVNPIMKSTPNFFRKLYEGGKKVVKLVEKVR